MESAPVLLQAHGVCHRFGTPVLRNFDLTLHRGEVHALVGGNGAGKSTLARILAGLLRPDAGAFELDGQRYSPGSRREAEARGVTLMLQELSVLPTLTLAENLFLHELPSRWGILRRRTLRERAARALDRVGLGKLDPETLAAGLGIGEQQLVELAGALETDCRLLILDEPTAALTSRETALLFAQIERLRAAGVGVVYISHRWEELQQIADRVSVLRDGERVVTMPMREATYPSLMRWMAGRELESRPPPRRRPPGEVVLRVTGLSVPPAVQEVSFEVHAGEVFGLSGLVGAGRTEVLRALFGADRFEAGIVELWGSRVDWDSPADAVEAGMALVPEDRKAQGLLLPEGVRANTALPHLCGWLADLERENHEATAVVDRLAVRCDHLEQPVRTLSGGNQQKVMVGRWLAREARVVLLDEPTRGVDVPARERIHALVRELAEEGRALVVVSSELSELMTLCDRIAVMSAGRITQTFRAGDWDVERLTEAAFRGHAQGNRIHDRGSE